MLSAAQMRATAAAAALALFGQAALPGVHPPAHRGTTRTRSAATSSSGSGDEAAAELQTAAEGQFLLTEVLMLESVDRLIMKRLSLRPYSRWRRQFLKLREAQRTPTHWGLEPACPLARLLPRLEPRTSTLVIGSAAEPAAYLLAAHDAAVTFIAGDMGAVERVESRMATEALGQHVRWLRRSTGPGLPDFVGFITGSISSFSIPAR